MRRNDDGQSVKDIVQTIKARKGEDPGGLEEVQRLLPSGSTVLNCAMSDSEEGGVGAGKVINFVGDSGVGKTMIIETIFAEMANDPKYDDYDLYLDDAEHALEMDIEKLFGKKTAARVKAPRYDANGIPINSDTVEQFFANVMRLIRDGRKFVYGLDSLDTLTAAEEYEAADALVKAADKADNSGDLSMQGSYGMGKQKMLSQILRTIKAGLAKTGSTLIIISQTRDNINARPGQPTKRRAGGRALEFYCTHTVWLNSIKTLKGGKGDAEEVIGKQVKAEVKKNKLTGKIRSAIFDIYYDYGIDDITSCVDFLASQGVLKKAGAYLIADALGVPEKMFRKDLVTYIEEYDLIPVLRKAVGDAWKEKEDALSLNRKPKYV